VSSRLPRSVVSLLGAGALGGCATAGGAGDTGGDAAGSAACFADPPESEIGTGDVAFIPLHDGDQVPVIHGSQGGNHLLGSVRVHHLDPIALVHFSLTSEEGVLISDQTYRIALLDEGDCTTMALGLYAYLGFMGGGTESEDIANALLWTNVAMHIDVTDTGGRQTAADVTIVPTPSEPVQDDTGRPPPDTGDTGEVTPPQ
jgi:hypothetical protein